MDRTALDRELKRLRQRAGLTVKVMRQCPELKRALGTTSDQEAVHLFERRLRSLGPGLNAQALRNAFGLGLEPFLDNKEVSDKYGIKPGNRGTLTQRRQMFGGLNGNRLPDAVQDWEDLALDELISGLSEQPAVGKRAVETLLVAATLYPSGAIKSVNVIDEERKISVAVYVNEFEQPTIHMLTYRLPDYEDLPRKLMFLIKIPPRGERAVMAFFRKQSTDLIDYSILRIGDHILSVEADDTSVWTMWDEPTYGVYYGIFWGVGWLPPREGN